MGLQQIPSKGGIPSGNTAARPGAPVIGDTYYDGTLGFLMIFDGTNFIPCSAPASQPTIAVTDVGTSVAYGTVQASVAFTEGVTGGKAAGFTAIQGSTTQTSTSNPVVITVTGTPGSYAFTGTSYNGFGVSPSSPSVSQTLTSVPEAPTIGTASATGNSGEISLTFTAGATGGKSITNYQWSTDGTTYTALSPADAISPVIISGLTNGTSYTFRLKAVNANGVSSASSASNSVSPTTAVSVGYLVVGGGGGGCGATATAGGMGGGGAGGLRSTVTATGGGGTLETGFSAIQGTTYTITIGGGGNGGTGGGDDRGGAAGGNSSISGSGLTTITAQGGGGGSGNGGGSRGGSPAGGRGCGGGAGYGSTADSGTANQGFAGGNGGGHPYYCGGGGGGAGADGQVGQPGGANQGGNGGNGVAVEITGSSVYYAGGGGGGVGIQSSGVLGTGGLGGGANAAVDAVPTAATANFGGGGGGNSVTGNYAGGAGGSGVVIVRALQAAASTTGSPTATTSGSFYIYKFTGNGSITY
jgi:hypothetical protein